MIRAGKMRHSLDVERFVQTGVGDRGQPVGQWQAVYSDVPAALEPLAGRHAEVARQLVATATHEVTIRWRPGVLPGMRLVGTTGQYAGRTFNVGYVGDGDGRQHDLALTTTEQATGAT